LDNEEFLPGLLCLGVLVPPPPGGVSNMGLALQAPLVRLPLQRALTFLPVLQKAALAIAGINDDLPMEAEGGDDE
jgi:DNA-binding IclR family transcriptional regulator